MTKEKMLEMAMRNNKKAKIAYDKNINRPGITEQEIENLKNNVMFTNKVIKLINIMEE